MEGKQSQEVFTDYWLLTSVWVVIFEPHISRAMQPCSGSEVKRGMQLCQKWSQKSQSAGALTFFISEEVAKDI